MSSTDDEFNEIVKGLELDVSGLADLDQNAARRAQEAAETPPPEVVDDDDDVAFDDSVDYRRVDPPRPMSTNTKRAWITIAAAVVAIVASVVSPVNVPSFVIAALAVAAVGAGVWLVMSLPSHGPSQRDWPDDGAAL